MKFLCRKIRVMIIFPTEQFFRKRSFGLKSRHSKSNEKTIKIYRFLIYFVIQRVNVIDCSLETLLLSPFNLSYFRCPTGESSRFFTFKTFAKVRFIY